MSKFRKKPVVIEAVRFPADPPMPKRFQRVVCRAQHFGMADPPVPHIHSLEGPHYVKSGDWIIRGIQGEFYACNPDIFAATYEAVTE